MEWVLIEHNFSQLFFFACAFVVGMVDIYKTNDKELSDLEKRADLLNGQMNDYLAKIQSDSVRYRQCTS